MYAGVTLAPAYIGSWVGLITPDSPAVPGTEATDPLPLPR